MSHEYYGIVEIQNISSDLLDELTVGAMSDFLLSVKNKGSSEQFGVERGYTSRDINDVRRIHRRTI